MNIYKQGYKNNIFVYFSLWFFLMTGHSYQAFANEPSGETIRIISDEEIPIILDLISGEIRDNYELIITWSGRINVKLNMLHTGSTAESVFKSYTDAKGEIPEAVLQKAEEKITFAIVAKKNCVYVDKFRENRSNYFNYTTGINLGNSRSSPYWSTSIARPDFLFEASPKSFDKKDNTIRQRKAVKKPLRIELTKGLYQDIDDPRKTFLPGGGFTWNHLDRLVELFHKRGKIEFDGYRFKMEENEKGDIIDYKIVEPSIISLERNDPNDYIIITKIFSSQCGFNMIYWEAASGGGIPMQEFTWEYELISGVYLPKRVVEKHYGSGKQVVLEKESNYINNKVNQEIPADTFEYVNLHLKERDIFIDEIANKEYRYEEATQTLKPVEK